MANISLQQITTKPFDEIHSIVNDITGDLASRYGIQSKWLDDHRVGFQRQGLKGKLVIDEQLVKIDLKLGLLLNGFASTIKAELKRAMKEKLG